MLIERLLFRHLAGNDYRQHDVQQLSFLCCLTMQRCDGWPISIRSPKFFRALKSAEHLWGQWWGQLDFVSITFHSAIRFPPPPPERTQEISHQYQV